MASLQETQIELLMLGLHFDVCTDSEGKKFAFIEGEVYSREDLILLETSDDRNLFDRLGENRALVQELLLEHV